MGHLCAFCVLITFHVANPARRVEENEVRDHISASHQYYQDKKYSLPPYGKRELSFEFAYGTQHMEGTYWDPALGSFGAEHKEKRMGDALKAMLHLIKQTYHGTHKDERDVFRRCRLGEFTTSKGKSWGVSCNESPQYCAEQRANCKEEEDVCKTQLTACEKEIPVCQDKQKPCVWKTFKMLGYVLGSLKYFNDKVSGSCQHSISGRIERLTDAVGSNAMNGNKYNEEAFRTAMLALENELAGTEYSWTHSLNQKFFYDSGGARQGMWVFLHAVAERAPELISEIRFRGDDGFQQFWSSIMKLLNPCPTCRTRFKTDIKFFPTESKSIINETKILKRASTKRAVSEDWTQFRLNVWLYHNEVSQRVQTGMRQDLEKIDVLRLPTELDGIEAWTQDSGNIERAQELVDDWKAGTIVLATDWRARWTMDKRWPSFDMCKKCWKDTGKSREEDDKDNFNIVTFQSWFNIVEVLKFLELTYRV